MSPKRRRHLGPSRALADPQVVARPLVARRLGILRHGLLVQGDPPQEVLDADEVLHVEPVHRRQELHSPVEDRVLVGGRAASLGPTLAPPLAGPIGQTGHAVTDHR
eukprot:6026000-Pyramimonas_sp.AAC.1